MEVMDFKGKYTVTYQDYKFKIFKVKDKYKLLAVNRKNGKSKTLFTGTKEECQQHKEQIDDAWEKGCIIYSFT